MRRIASHFLKYFKHQNQYNSKSNYLLSPSQLLMCSIPEFIFSLFLFFLFLYYNIMENQFHIKGYQDVLDPDWTMHLDQPSKIEFKAAFKSTNNQASKNYFQENINFSEGATFIKKPNKKSRYLQKNGFKTIAQSVQRLKTLHNKSKNHRNVSQANVKKHVQTFVAKMTRSIKKQNSMEEQELKVEGWYKRKGLLVPQFLEVTKIILNTINFLFLFSILSFGIVFDSILENQLVNNLQILSLIITFCNMFANLLAVTQANGKRIDKLSEIWLHYLKGEFIYDLSSIAILFLDATMQGTRIKYFRVIHLLKFPDFKRNIQKLEFIFINSFYRQHYWGISHLMMTNFMVAHIIAITMILISHLDEQHNWMKKSNIYESEWYQQYSWAYYWAVTTMLSIGYGDITVSNYKEAICMVFIEIFSCIILAYTINSVGNLIKKLQQKKQERTKNLITFKQIIDNNKISEKLSEKVNCHINEKTEIKTKFNYEKQKMLIDELPENMKYNVITECNLPLFQDIQVFKSMSYKILTELANKLCMKIAHPEQLIFSPLSASSFDLQILKQGRVGYFTSEERLYSRFLMNQLKIEKGQNARPLALATVTGNMPNFNICSLDYSVLYYLSLSSLQQVIQQYPIDRQKYSFEKDKSKHILDEFQTLVCESCKSRHTKGGCPKLHYMPFKQTLYFKYIRNKKKKDNKSKRSSNFERKKVYENCYRLNILFRLFKDTTKTEQQIYQIGKITSEKKTIDELTTIVLDYLIEQQKQRLRPNQPLCSIVKIKNVQKQRKVLFAEETGNNKISVNNTGKSQNISSCLSTLQFVKNNTICNLRSRLKTNHAYTHVYAQLQQLKNKSRKKAYFQPSDLEEMMGIDIDVLKDYIYYFPQNNPKVLSRKVKMIGERIKNNITKSNMFTLINTH